MQHTDSKGDNKVPVPTQVRKNNYWERGWRIYESSYHISRIFFEQI